MQLGVQLLLLLLLVAGMDGVGRRWRMSRQRRRWRVEIVETIADS